LLELAPGEFTTLRRRAILLSICCSWLIGAAAQPDERLLRVGTSGDYPPFSQRVGEETPGEAGRFEGLDLDVARAYAKDRGLTLRFVPFRWPELLDDLAAGRFDVAMSGITVRPERSLAGRFSVPVATSGAVILAPAGAGLWSRADLSRPGLRVAVNAGGHLERVTRATMPAARVIAVPKNADVLAELAAGRADAVMTDSREAPHWQARRPGLHLIGPLTQDRKAYLVAPDRSALARDLDAWLLTASEAGRLEKTRVRWLGPGSGRPRTADPLSATLAAIDERLALMPLVAEAKRASGSAVEAPEREARVIEAALEAVRAASDEAGRRPPEAAAVRALFRAQIEAAKAIQRRVLAAPSAHSDAEAPDLTGALRPALIRIGDRLARLLVRLPAEASRSQIRQRAGEALSKDALTPDEIETIADALHEVCCAARPGAEGASPPD
jgi:cyclohexadienyl dehydratase